MSIILFNRYGINAYNTQANPVPTAPFIFDAQTLVYGNGASIVSVNVGTTILTVPTVAGTAPFAPITRTAPTYNATGINGKPSMQFNGIDYLQSPQLTDFDSTNYSFYAVVTTTSTANFDTFVRIGNEGSLSSGAWIVDSQNGPNIGTISGGTTSNQLIHPISTRLQFVLSTRVNLLQGRKTDIVSLELPEIRRTETVFATAGTPNYFEFTAGQTRIGLSGANNYNSSTPMTATFQFGELRMFKTYLSDIDHENTIQSLLTKWR